jgi:hypothetical protein
MYRVHVIRLVVVLIAAAFYVQGALAWGEPKNEPPFTRETPRAIAAAVNGAFIDVRGEPKNQLPFTRRVVP